MSWKRCSGFLIVTPIYCCASGHGLQQYKGGQRRGHMQRGGEMPGRIANSCEQAPSDAHPNPPTRTDSHITAAPE